MCFGRGQLVVFWALLGLWRVYNVYFDVGGLKFILGESFDRFFYSFWYVSEGYVGSIVSGVL